MLEPDGRREAGARALSQLLVMQGVAVGLPEPDAVLKFLAGGLAEMPGIATVIPFGPGGPAWDGHDAVIPLASGGDSFGGFAVAIDDAESFDAILPFIRTTLGIIASFLELRRDQRSGHEREQRLHVEVRKTRRELLLIEHDLQAILNTIPDIFFRTGDSDRVVMVSPGVFSILGYAPETFLGTRMSDHHVDPELYLRERERVLAAQGEVVMIEGMMRHKSGAEVWVSTNAAARFDARGQFTGIDGIARDDTAKKRAERDLLTAKDLAEQANRLKTQFLANMSHELRTPLNAIIGFSEFMGLEALGPLGAEKYREYLIDIKQSGEHLLEVINDILDVARIEAGRVELRPDAVALAPMVDSCVRLVADRARMMNLRIEIDVPAGLPALAVDPLRFRQVLLNLLTNAVKFNRRGGTITVSARRHDMPPGGLLVTIADTGIGIAEKDIPLVLEAFGQVSDAYTRPHDGTGLGLPLCRSLMTLHGGDLLLESVPGAGTTVTLVLPESCVKRG
ncbi:histidine protein kinase [Skermanella stibiiresistens SB22]|uniref:histidine kinase n=1 Tax=Skermanella stibiiresistens SB22 TaxID=1385369 RepID=W9H2C7_9PROT|nr:PAS domain-containing sensor histidine kinase [Skermanella stibiiresistens]EWY38867.1 histidine protein kinase [Skermanella stibiiresistens SB22]